MWPLSDLFSTAGFPARWNCGPGWKEDPWIGYLHVGADVATFLAYYAVPLVVTVFALRRRDLKLPAVFYVFLGLIFFSCGTVHLVEAGIFWWPMYRLSGVLKLVTALVSCAGVVVLVRVLPKAMQLRSGDDFHRVESDRREAEASLEFERNLLHTLMNHLPDAICFKDKRGRYLRVSRSMSERLGLEGPELADGEDSGVYLKSDYARRVSEDERRILETGEPTIGVVERVTWPDGSKNWVSITRAPLHDPDGELIGTFSVSRDITRIIEAEELLRANQERFELCVRGSNDGIWDWQLATSAVYYAPRFKELLGYQDHEMENVFDAWKSKLHPDDVEPTMKAVAAHLDDRAPYDVEYRLRTKSGDYRWFRARGQALWDEQGRPTRMAGSITEITKRKRAEQQLRAVASKLALPGEAPRSEQPVQLSNFTLRDMISCGADIRRMSVEVDSEDQLAAELVRYLRRRIVDDEGRPAFSLVRLFRTFPLDSLPPQLHQFAISLADGVELAPETKCLTLLGTAGELPQWNDCRQSTGHQAIPLPSVEKVEELPMIAQLVRQLGLDAGGIFEGRGDLMLEDVGTGVFHIADAAGSPFIPAQAEFVEPHGIRSVIGFGDLLPSGQLFAVICFSTVPIPHETAVLFSHLSICTRLSMLPCEEQGTPRIESQILTVDSLIGNYEEVVCAQEAKLDDAMSELRDARDFAEAASRAKSDFLANMSHEIRTPMNGIIGMAELLANTKMTDEQREYLGLVRHSAESLLHLLNDILDFSKIEAGKLELESIPFDLRDIVGRTAQTLGIRAAEKGLELNCRIAPSLPEKVIGDPGRLRQILVNLVGNAVKFTQRGEVTIDVSEQTTQGEVLTLLISVSDTGIGIAPGKVEGIFEAFSQADESMTRRYGGTGLGLAICKQLVLMMNGRIWLESQEGVGTTFYFTAALPVAEPPNADEDQQQMLEGLRVLVVDDNKTNRRVLEEILSSWQLETGAAEDGPSALRELERAAAAGDPFEIVLLDCMMPHMDGFEVARRIRGMSGPDSPRVIMISSAARPGDATRCRELGVERYMTKPVVQSHLLEVLLAVTGHAAPTESLAVEPAKPAEMPPLDVLLVEDGLVNQQVALGLLRLHGHRVTITNNGREAVEQFAPGRFDIVLMDVQMPEMDGLEATAAIRQVEPPDERTPIVAMTAAAMKGDRERCLESGMDAYISKPIDAAELYQLMAQLTGHKALPAGNRSASKEDASPADDVFDLQAVRDRIGGNDDDLREVAGMMIEEARTQLEQMRRAAESEDDEVLSRAAHTLHGAAELFAATTLVEAAKQVGNAVREGGDVRPLLNTVETEVNRLTTAIRAWLDKAGPEDGPPADR